MEDLRSRAPARSKGSVQPGALPNHYASGSAALNRSGITGDRPDFGSYGASRSRPCLVVCHGERGAMSVILATDHRPPTIIHRRLSRLAGTLALPNPRGLGAMESTEKSPCLWPPSTDHRPPTTDHRQSPPPPPGALREQGGGQKVVRHVNQHHGDDHGAGGGLAHAHGATAGGEALLAGHHRHNEPKHDGFQ